MRIENTYELRFDVVQNGTFEMTPEKGVTENRPTCSLLTYTKEYLKEKEQYNVMIDIDHPVKDPTDIIDSLASIGMTPGQINAIILTHLHPDHIGHKDLFPNALFIFHEAERFAFYFKNNKTLTLEGSAIWKICDNKMPDPVRYTPDLKNLNKDIYIRHCPGHTKGSLMIFVCINGLVHAFAGGTFLNRKYYEKWQPPGMSWKQSRIYDHMSFLKENADVVVPGHGKPFEID